MQKMPVFFSVLLCKLKSRVTEICPNPAKRNLLRLWGDILPYPRFVGTVAKLGDLTNDEYSFGVKRTASRHLSVRRKTPPPLRGSSPCEAGQFFPAGFDYGHSKVCKAGTLYHPIASSHFPNGVESQRMRAVSE